MEAEIVSVLTRQGSQLQEVQQTIRRLHPLMNQADQRSKDAEEKASVAFTTIGVVKTARAEEKQAQQPTRRDVLAKDVHR